MVKNLFGHRKLHYKGLVTNTAQLQTLFGLANLVMGEKDLHMGRWRGMKL
jgi:IS5 family transposase